MSGFADEIRREGTEHWAVLRMKSAGKERDIGRFYG